MNEASLIEAMLLDPHENQTALVYSDWLDDNGHTDRADLIRAEIRGEDSTEIQERCETALPFSDELWRKIIHRWDTGLLSIMFHSSFPIDEADLEALCLVPYVTTLQCVGLLEPKLLASLSRFPNIRALEHDSPETLSVRNIRAIRELPQIIRLTLGMNSITDKTLSHVAEMKQLRVLEFVCPEKITNKGVAQLKALTKLKKFTFMGCEQIGDDALDCLPKMRELEHLSLSETGVTDAGVKRLTSLKNLRHLDLGFTKVTAKSLKTLVRCKKLHTLILADADGINDTNIIELAKLPDLRVLDLRRTGVTRYRLPRFLEATNLDVVRVEASMALHNAYSEEKEIRAFVEACREQNVLAEMDYE